MAERGLAAATSPLLHSRLVLVQRSYGGPTPAGTQDAIGFPPPGTADKHPVTHQDRRH